MQNRTFTDLYTFAGKLGEGQHASVYKCFRRCTQGSEETLPTPFAVKVIRSDDEEKIKAHVREFEILKQLSHPSVCGAVELIHDNLHNVIYQVMEFVDGNEILETIAAHETGLSESKVKILFKQLLEVVDYLHRNRTCHRDIKPSNILVDRNLSKLTIIDFNVAKRVNDEDAFLMYTRSTGALAFAAPERLKESCVYSEKVDTWACGIILFMLLTGKHPFDTESSIVQLMQEIIRGEGLAR